VWLFCSGLGIPELPNQHRFGGMNVILVFQLNILLQARTCASRRELGNAKTRQCLNRKLETHIHLDYYARLEQNFRHSKSLNRSHKLAHSLSTEPTVTTTHTSCSVLPVYTAMSLTNMAMTADPEKAEQEAGGPVQSRRESAEEYKPAALPLQQGLPMTDGDAGDPKPADAVSSLISHEPEIVYKSKQAIARKDRDEELRLAQVDIKTRLDEVSSGLRELKAKLKVKEDLIRARRSLSKRAAAVEEKDLNVKIEKAKEQLSAREEQAALRRAKKNDMREKWAQKQKTDYEKREARRSEQTGQESEVNDSAEPASAAAVMEPKDWDNFDIDIYDE